MTTPDPINQRIAEAAMNLVIFEGCVVAVIAPEDLEALWVELRKAREQVRIAREYLGACECTCIAYDEENTVACSRCDTLKRMEAANAND